jgi:hypothetical protein
LITGATAAIALPPHIAVPEDISIAVFLSKPNKRPSNKPTDKVKKTEQAVSQNAFDETLATVSRFIEKPINTIDDCSIMDVNPERRSSFKPINDIKIPQNKANAGVAMGNMHKRATNRYRWFLFLFKKSFMTRYLFAAKLKSHYNLSKYYFTIINNHKL